MQHPIKILIVEDEMSIALELEMLIDELDYELIDIIDNAEEALTIILEKSPDLILMDIGIKGKYSGIEVAEKIKHLPIAILFITNYHSKEIFQRAKSTNFAGYLTKPISKISVQSAIEIALRLRSNYTNALPQESYSAKNSPPFEKESIFILRLKKYILDNLSDSALNGEQIAKKMRISRMQLHRKIKALTNYSISTYIQSVRLEEAYKLLEKQEKNISEIAYETGFSSPNHFSRLFKNKYGKAPSHFLK